MRPMLIAALCAMPVFAQCAPDKAAYELQARCGRDADSLFQKSYSADLDKTALESSFENYYNARLNSCFMLVNTTIVLSKETLLSARLIEVNQHHEVGSIVSVVPGRKVTHCVVEGVACTSTEEFKAAIAAYMRQ